MTIDELIERLEEYRDELGGDTEVRLMTQQNWPFENGIAGLASGAEINGAGDEPDDDDVADDAVVFIIEGGQLCYGSEASPGSRLLKPKRPLGRRGGWFPPPEDGSPIRIDHEDSYDGHEDDHEEGSEDLQGPGREAGQSEDRGGGENCSRRRMP